MVKNLQGHTPHKKLFKGTHALATQNNGTIGLELSDAVTWALAQRALDQHRFDFMVVVTGDDNPNSDCAYSPFVLEVGVEYVLL